MHERRFQLVQRLRGVLLHRPLKEDSLVLRINEQHICGEVKLVFRSLHVLIQLVSYLYNFSYNQTILSF